MIAGADSQVVIGSPLKQSMLVIFSDFQCPSCAELERNVDFLEVIKNHPEVTIAFRDYPLPYHSWARSAALANKCAFGANPEKYLEYRKDVFDMQKELTPDNVKAQLFKIAEKVGIDRNVFEDCLTSESAKKAVDEDIQAGDTIQLSGTPTTILNGVALPTIWSTGDFQKRVKEHLDRSDFDCGVSTQPPSGSCKPAQAQSRD